MDRADKKQGVFTVANMAKIGILSAIAVLLMLLDIPLVVCAQLLQN